MTPDPDNLKIFADPELKAALMKAYPAVRAPESLKARIENLIEEELAVGAGQSLKLTPATVHAGWRWLATGRRLVAAACIAGLALGIGLYSVTHGTSTSQPQLASGNSDPVLVDTAVARHDELGVSVNDAQYRQLLRSAPQMSDELRQQKAIKLPVVDLSPLGWEFVGAKSNPADGLCLGQLFYKRDKQALSVLVFSDDQARRTPASCIITQRHIVALRKIENGVVCIVGSCPAGQLQQNEIEKIASRFAGH